jgi:hypothetical protein
MHIYDTHSNTWQQCGAYMVLTWHSHGVNVTYVTICSHVGEHMFSNGNPNFKVLGTHVHISSGTTRKNYGYFIYPNSLGY